MGIDNYVFPAGKRIDFALVSIIIYLLRRKYYLYVKCIIFSCIELFLRVLLQYTALVSINLL
jgi:hypothetical protein